MTLDWTCDTRQPKVDKTHYIVQIKGNKKKNILLAPQEMED